MQVLDLPDVVFLCVVEYFQQIVRLISNGEMLPLLRLKNVFSKKHRVIIWLTNIWFPVALLIIKGIYELFESFKIVENLSVFGNEIIDLFSFCFNAIQLRD